MPFRLLAVGAPLDEGDPWGRLLKSCAESGVGVTLASVTPAEQVDPFSSARRLGIHLVALMDGTDQPRPADLEAGALGIITAIRPHVVVAASNDAPIWPALVSAVSKARRSDRGSAALPAKLYYRLSEGSSRVAVTTLLCIPGALSPALLVRVNPEPWITGVLERDLFSGLSVELDDARRLPAAS